jgi:hypothetical protein
MDEQMVLFTNEAPLFDGTNCSSWRERMKIYLKSRGSGVWDLVLSKPWYLTTSMNKSKIAKEEKRNNSMALKEIRNGLSCWQPIHFFLIALKKAAYTSCLLNDKSSSHCATRHLFHFCDNCNLVSFQFSQLKV